MKDRTFYRHRASAELRAAFVYHKAHAGDAETPGAYLVDAFAMQEIAAVLIERGEMQAVAA